jgi:hypothetical protein
MRLVQAHIRDQILQPDTLLLQTVELPRVADQHAALSLVGHLRRLIDPIVKSSLLDLPEAVRSLWTF